MQRLPGRRRGVKQEILEMIEPQSEYGHRTVSMFLAFHGLPGGQDLTRDAGPDKGSGHAREQG